jgi:hypothetical protein
MRKIFLAIGIICLSAGLFGWVSFSKQLHSAKKIIADDGPELNYKNFCSGCHGEKMDAFVDRKWKHGSEKDDLLKLLKLAMQMKVCLRLTLHFRTKPFRIG